MDVSSLLVIFFKSVNFMRLLYHTYILWIHVTFRLDIFGALTTESCEGAHTGLTICACLSMYMLQLKSHQTYFN
jgi:hypothetical protein